MHADFPLPDVSWPPLHPFWEGAASGRLLIPRCDGCDRFDWYPTPSCPACGERSRTWVEMSGRATLFSWTVVNHAWIPEFRTNLPFTTGLVALEEDERVRLATMIVDTDADSLVPDLPVEVTFGPLTFPPSTKRVTAPFFRARTGF